MFTQIQIHMTRMCLPFALVFFILGVQEAPALTPEEKQAIAQLQNLNTAYKAIARQVTPSVVTVKVKKAVEQRRSRRRGRPDLPDFFWRRPAPEDNDSQENMGSGIVITPDGYILTNHHVAGDALRITVVLPDNQEFEATLVGADPRTDVAVIKIDTQNLATAKLGISDGVQIGEWVLAIGAPLGLESTVTAGIVSARGRNIHLFRDELAIEDFIQTDAAINQGNSGGALVNLNGEVIGVNTAIATSTGNFVGYGFAIPIDLARKVMDDIIAHGEVRRGFLGVALKQVTAAEADAFGLDRPTGVLIGRVYSDTPADKANLQRGDIILKVDGKEVKRPNQIQSQIAMKHPGDSVNLTIQRMDKIWTTRAVLDKDFPKNEVQTASFRQTPSENEIQQLGLTVQNITGDNAREYGLDNDIEGALVVEVERGVGRASGFEVGDVIFDVRQSSFVQNIRSTEDFDMALEKLEKGRNASFSVYRQGRPRFVTVKIPK
ncbi:MAG: Do family serine endopeptidase [bacterium]|nr:Do family serine endopeptidase [bacterium]